MHVDMYDYTHVYMYEYRHTKYMRMYEHLQKDVICIFKTSLSINGD